MDNWLNLNKRPCWDSIRDPFVSEANPWTTGLCYLFTPFLIPNQFCKIYQLIVKGFFLIEVLMQAFISFQKEQWMNNNMMSNI